MPAWGGCPRFIRRITRNIRESGLVWPLSRALLGRDMEACLFPPPPGIPSKQRPVPDWPTVHVEMRRKGVTLMLLWQEYNAVNPDGFQYSWFCDTYQAWRSRRDLVMRQTHRAGETVLRRTVTYFARKAAQWPPSLLPLCSEYLASAARLAAVALLVYCLGVSSGWFAG